MKKYIYTHTYEIQKKLLNGIHGGLNERKKNTFIKFFKSYFHEI